MLLAEPVVDAVPPPPEVLLLLLLLEPHRDEPSPMSWGVTLSREAGRTTILIRGVSLVASARTLRLRGHDRPRHRHRLLRDLARAQTDPRVCSSFCDCRLETR